MEASLLCSVCKNSNIIDGIVVPLEDGLCNKCSNDLKDARRKKNGDVADFSTRQRSYILLPPKENKRDHSLISLCNVFSALASPVRIRILMVIFHSGPKHYTELMSTIGFQTKNQSGRFAFHLRVLQKKRLITRVDRYLWGISTEGKILALAIEQITNPRSPLVQASEFAPTLVEAMSKVREAFNSVDALNARLPTRNGTTKFFLPEPVTFDEASLNFISEGERIKEKKRQADLNYYEPPEERSSSSRSDSS